MARRSDGKLEAINALAQPRRADRRGVLRVAVHRSVERLPLAAALLGLVAGLGHDAAAQQYPGAGCVATMQNRSTLIDADGIYALPNIPAIPGQYRVHIVCPQSDGTLLGATSDYVNLLGTTNTSIPLLPLTAFTPGSQILYIQILSGSLSALGATVQLSVTAFLPPGEPTEASHGTDGTTYISSNQSVATVSQDGLVTATGPGSVTITANNDGLVATILLNSFSSLDSDGDGMPDAYEIANGLNPYDPTDAGLDPDGDGLTNLQEYKLGTNPHVADTDGDGINDGQEVALGTNPLVADTDGDGLSDGQEVALGTNPLVADTDGDGIPDGVEVKIGTNPLVADVTTTVTGYVTNADGSPHPGASVVVLTYFTAATDSTGTFTLLHVPVTLGNIIASAEAVVAGTVFSASSNSTPAVGGGTTNVGTIQLGQNAGQVTGFVTTPDNKPAPGVQVVVTGFADTRYSVTDATGLYIANGLKPGLVSVAALDPGTSLRGQAVGTLSAGAPLSLNVKLAPYGTISGTVTNAIGASVGPGVPVTVNGAPINATTSTDALGNYSFPFVGLGSVTLDATDSTGNHGRTSAIVTATSQTINANIQYLGRGTVTGVVSDAGGHTVAGAAVQLANNGIFYSSFNTVTNSIGQFTFNSVFVGPLTLSATAASNGGTASTAITKDGQTITANITLQPTGTVAGTVYANDGKTAVAGATVTLDGTALTAVTSALGAYTITNAPLGTYTVTAAASGSPDRGRANASLTVAGATVAVNINLTGLGTVNVTVVDGGGVPAAGAIVQLYTNSSLGFSQNGVTAANGIVTFTQQIAGGIVVNASNQASGLSGQTAAALAAGQTLAVTVHFQPAGNVQGTVYRIDGVTPLPNTTVEVDNTTSTLTNASGQYVLTGVLAGSHTVSVVDAFGNILAYTLGVNLASQGQSVTINFVTVGRGTVIGQVTNSDGSPAGGVPVQISSSTVGYGAYLVGAADVNGNFIIPNVPVGSYTVIGQQHTASTNSYGTASGIMISDGSTTITNVQLSSSLVPTTLLLYDANGLAYPIRETGGLFNGSYSVFAGDSDQNQGASRLSLVQNGTETKFTGAAFAPIDLGAKQISITQNGLAGLNVTRRVYVPGDGYFARYVELITNPGVKSVTIDVKLTTNFRPVKRDLKINGTTFQDVTVPHILATSSGDNIINIADPQTPDHWVTFGPQIDQDPFLPDEFADTQIPTVADVFDGPGAPLVPTAVIYTTDQSGAFSTLTDTFGSVTVPAGGTVGILHFVSQENLYASANASATRLVQLPPESIYGLSSADLSTIGNFVIPAGGTSTVAPLSTLNNQVAGFVYGSDNKTLVPGAMVYLQSTDPIFARTYIAGADATGAFSFVGAPGGAAVPAENFNLYAFHPLTSTALTASCAQLGQYTSNGCAIISPTVPGSFTQGSTSAAQDIVFSNTGILTGTVSRGPTVLNVNGTITLSGGAMNPVTVPILSDGTYTITGVLQGSYNILAQVTNTLLTGITTTTITPGQTTVTNVTIGGSGNVSGLVTRGDGSLAISDVVNLRVTGQNGLIATVDTGGHYAFTDIPIGTYSVDVFDGQTNSAANATFSVAANATTTQNLVLQSSGTITGNLSANDGSSIANLTVTLVSTTTNGVQNLTTTANATGGYTFTNVKPGSIVLRATNAVGLQGTGTGALPLAGQTVTINVALIAAGNVTGTVFQGDGVTPAAGIQVTINPAPLTGSATTTTDANGVYNFPNESFGNFTINASNPKTGDHGQASSQIQINGQLRTVNVSLNGFANLTVKVVDSGANPIANAAVTLTSQNFNTVYNGTSDTTGTAQFTNVFAGPFSLTAKNPVSGLSAQTSGTLAYNASQAVTVTLQAVGTVRGIVYLPDGVTPVAGATVSAYSYGPQVKTGTDGSYVFNNAQLGSYSLTAYDSTGTLRATSGYIQLQTAGSTLTQNLTFVGVASVTGLVTKADGTPAENYTLTIVSKNSTIGGTQNVSTGGDGTYTVAEVPIGVFTVTVANLPSNLAGYASSAIVSNGTNVTVNIQIIASTVTLPLTLTDADGYTYTVGSEGTYGPTGAYGGLNPFLGASALTLNVGGIYSTFGSGGAPTTAIQSLSGQQVEITQPNVAGLTITRKVYVPTDGYFSRRIDVLQNPTASPITVNVQIGGTERYTKFTPQLITTSNGNKTVDKTILWAVDDDDNGSQPYPQTQPALANIFEGTGAATGLANVVHSVYTPPYYPNQGPIVYSSETWTYYYNPITIPANSSVSLLFFTAQEATPPTAVTAAKRLVQLPAEALAGLSASDLATVVNFAIPATQTLPAVAPPPANTLNGHIYAGDGTTPIPNALVYTQSTDLIYGFGAQATADVNGLYSVPTFIGNGYAAEAIDPATNVTAPTVTGTYPANISNQTQDISFTNTGILQGVVKATGSGSFPSGTVFLDLPCSNGILYCNQNSYKFTSNGTFSFLTALAGNDGISAIVKTVQGGTIVIPANYGYFNLTIPAQQTTQFTLTVPALGSIVGVLTNADGSAAPGITVTAIPSGPGTLVSAITDSAGNFAFNGIVVDTYSVSATDPVTAGTVSKSVTISQDLTSTVNLTFLGKGTVVVTAHFANGNIASNSGISIATSTQPTTFSYQGYTTTDANGQVTLTNIPTGPFTIHAFYPGQSFYSTTTGTLNGNNQTQQVAVTLTPVGTISGKVTNADGSAATSVYVTAADTTNGQFNAYALTDSAGSYGMFPVPADRVINLQSTPSNAPSTAYFATATNQKVPGDGQTLTVNLRYPGVASVKVTVLQADGTPVPAGTPGNIYLNSSDGLQKYATSITSNSTATFNNVVEATFVAFVSLNYSSYSQGSKIFTVKPTDDGTTVQITIQATPTATIQGTVFASDGTTPIASNYNVSLLDIDSARVVYANPSAVGYSFLGAQVGASGYKLTPLFNNVNYPAQAATGTITTQGQVITQNFTLPISSIAGTVHLYDGVTPVPYANVYATQTASTGAVAYFNTTADANGVYQLNGPVTGSLVVTASDNNGVVGTATIALTSDTQIITGANVSLSAVGMVIGTVYDANHLVVPNVEVDVTSSANYGGFSTSATTDTNGNYQVTDVPVGNIQANVDLPDGTTVRANGVLVNNGDTITINAGTPPPLPSGTIFGTVYDSNQNPNSGATVTITPADPNAAPITATTDANGLYTATGVPLGSVSASASLTDGTTTDAVTGNLPDGITPVEIDLGLSNPGTVSGIVLDSQGNPIPNINVGVASTGDTTTSYGESTADDGSFIFGAIAPGTVTVTVTDNNDNVIGTATATLPYGGNVVVNVTTNTVGARVVRPILGRATPATVVAINRPPLMPSHPVPSKGNYPIFAESRSSSTPQLFAATGVHP